jgi:hypothetical protein
MFERKFDSLERANNKLIEQQNKHLKKQNEILDTLVKFLVHGPEFAEQEFESAEKDGIDDSVGDTQLDDQAEKQILEDFRKAGYPGDFFN